MKKINSIEKDIASLPPDAQKIIFDLVEIFKKSYSTKVVEIKKNQSENWEDFIGCIEAETDLSRNYKTYLKEKLNQKYDNH